MGYERELGSVDRGKIADLVLIDGDPLTDIDALRRPVAVFKAGTQYDPAELLKASGLPTRPP